PARAGVRHATVVPYGAYRCGNGDLVLLAVQSDLHWRNFCHIVLERPEWIDDPRFNTVPNRRINRDHLESAIEVIFQQWDRSEVNRRLEQADIPSGDLNTIAQFAEHPQLTSRDRWAAVDVPGGTMQAIRPPFGFGSFVSPMGAVPAVGTHTAAVLTELGWDAATIAELAANGAIGIVSS
ncbi:MAG TPA: CoA transferase, partial [Thermomicrobiales bacterium]|nr:CoA transferase [Thermomicrobiales bacterium]